MLAIEMDFFSQEEARGEELGRFDDILEQFLGCLEKNGNIQDGWQILELADHIQIRALAIAPDALEHENWSIHAREDFEKLTALSTSAPQIRVVPEKEQPSSACECKSPSKRLLFTTFLDTGSPIYCLDCQKDVPLYRVPFVRESQEHYELGCWKKMARALDGLWMNCSVGERFSYRQLARPNSDFMIQSRQLASEIEEKSGVPTYAFLMHHAKKWGKKCPLCAQNWVWNEAPNDNFALKCDNCRLISSIAVAESTPLRELHP